MKTSTFMRKHYRSAYEDPVRMVIGDNFDLKDADEERADLQEEFFEQLKMKCPEFLDLYDELIDAFLYFENVMFEEFYILGVKDRDKSLMKQK